MNLAVAAFNLACAVYWLCNGNAFAAVMSCIGAQCSIKAYKWAREL